MAIHPVIVQAIGYGVLLIAAIFLIGAIQKGFFWPFMKVKMSFGKLLLVRIIAINRTFYTVGEVVDSFLVFKTHKGEKRVSIPDNSFFYRTLNLNAIDIAEEKNAPLKPHNLEAVTGFDAKKHNDLYLRALYSPSIAQTYEKVILVLLIAAVIGLVVVLIMSYTILNGVGELPGQISQVTNVISASEGL